MTVGPKSVDRNSDDCLPGVTPALERRVLLLIAGVQFVNIVDFMMVTPLGPFFSHDLGFPLARLGDVASSYAISAAVSGFACAFFIDRFDRRSALTVCLLGLTIGTLLATRATSLDTLRLARVVAGAFGGPASSIALSIVADVIPQERRGRALGLVMTAFSIASVLGVPIGLMLAEAGGWQLPFYAVGVLGALTALMASVLLPKLRFHLQEEPVWDGEGYRPRPVRPTPINVMRQVLADSKAIASYGTTATANLAMFLVIPSIAAYVVGNLNYPRANLPILYACGGIASFLTIRPFGRLVDKYGAFRIGTIGTVCSMAVTLLGFGQTYLLPHPALIFVLFLTFSGMRNVAVGTQSTKVPSPSTRAGFMSMQSVVQHLAAGLGAQLATLFLSSSGDQLIGMDHIAWLSVSVLSLIPFLLRFVEVRLKASQTLNVLQKATV